MLDRSGRERVANNSYGVPEAEYKWKSEHSDGTDTFVIGCVPGKRLAAFATSAVRNSLAMIGTRREDPGQTSAVRPPLDAAPEMEG